MQAKSSQPTNQFTFSITLFPVTFCFVTAELPNKNGEEQEYPNFLLCVTKPPLYI